MLLTGAIFELKIYQNAFVSRALPWTPLGELTVLPRPRTGFQGALCGRGGEGWKGEGRREGKGRGGNAKGAFSHFIFYNLTTE